MINATGNSPKTKVARASKAGQQQQLHQQIRQTNVQNLQAIITPQGLPNRKLQTAQNHYLSGGAVGQRMQPVEQAGNIPNRTVFQNQRRQIFATTDSKW